MLGDLTKDTFKPDENYNEFYTGHKFEPLDERTALNVDLVLPRAAWALDVAKEIQATSLLDLCCLDGFVALTLANKLTLEAVGVDLSEPGIALANERALKHNLPATFHQMAIENYEGPEVLDPKTSKTYNRQPAFDLVTLFEAIEHFTDVDWVMAGIKRHLKPGGTLLISTPDAEGHFGIRNVEDTCHLTVWTHRHEGELPTATHEGKPIRSLPDYLESQGFTVIENEVYNELINVRATINP